MKGCKSDMETDIKGMNKQEGLGSSFLFQESPIIAIYIFLFAVFILLP